MGEENIVNDLDALNKGTEVLVEEGSITYNKKFDRFTIRTKAIIRIVSRDYVISLLATKYSNDPVSAAFAPEYFKNK